MDNNTETKISPSFTARASVCLYQYKGRWATLSTIEGTSHMVIRDGHDADARPSLPTRELAVAGAVALLKYLGQNGPMAVSFHFDTYPISGYIQPYRAMVDDVRAMPDSLDFQAVGPMIES